MSLVNLTKASQSEEFTHNFDEYGNYLYFERNDKDKPSCYENILGIAKKRIIIIDPHLSINEDPVLFEKVKAEKVDVKIMAVCKKGENEAYAKSYFDAIQDKLKKNLNEYDFSFCCFKQKPYKKIWINNFSYEEEPIYIWHDRYLLIDNRVFLIGASMNNQVSGEKSFGIFEVKDSGQMVKFIDVFFTNYEGLLVHRYNGWHFHHK